MFWIVDLLIPIVMILLGIYYSKVKANKPISNVSGFRTSESMKSAENWRYAHELSGKLLIRTGFILAVLVTASKLLFSSIKPEYLSLIHVFASILVYIVLTISVNRKLK